jgi:phage portal protein BeeE
VDGGDLLMARRRANSVSGGGEPLFSSAPLDESQWFGPLEPLAPVAPKGVAGRRFDLRPGYNLVTQPRGDARTSFRELRALADNYDLLRLVLETRKDQLAALEWGVRNKDEGKRDDADPRVHAVMDFLARPDREHDWATWLRALYEDMAVIDAATIYPRRDRRQQLYALELVDGATVKPLIDDHGRRPALPRPAYQQNLVGLPAVDYSAAELYYLPRNYRSAFVYGFPPVEQIVMTVNIALRRQLHQLEYYTSGTMPDALIGVPDTWTPQQIEEFQAYFDALLTDNTAERRKVRFVPAGISKGFVQTKEAALKDETDEWLARIVCYALSVSPQWAVKVMNRATAESAHEEARQEGLQPWMQWGKAAMDHCLDLGFGYGDLEFYWEEADDPDIDKQSQRLLGQLERGAITLDEFRAETGRNPYPGGIGAKPLIYTSAGAVTLESVLNPPPAAIPEGNLSELGAGKGGMAKAERISTTLTEIFANLLAREGKRLAAAVRRMKKAGGDDDPFELDPDAWEEAEAAARAELERLAQGGVGRGAAEIGLADEKLTELANPRAVQWAEAHAAELVSGVRDTTRAQLKALVAESEEEGWSVAALAGAIGDSTAFAAERAQRIAETETRFADNQGALTAWQSAKDLGVEVKKRWLARGENVCAECQSNEADGAIDVDDSFNSGDDAPPAHPGCECDIEPVLADPSTGSGEGE